MGKWIQYVLCLCLCMGLVGCVDGNDPENLEYIITLGVDVAEEGYAFTFVPAKTKIADTTLLSATGTTLSQGISYLDQENPRKTEMGQLKMIVLGKEVLQSKDYMDLLLEWERSQDISGNVMLLATENTAKECLETILAEDGETGLFLWDFYENTAEDVAVTWGEDVDGFLTALAEQEQAVIVPKISTDGSTLSLGGGLLLAEKQYVATLDNKDALGYAFLREEADGAVLVAEKNGETIPLRIMKNKVSYEIQKQGETVFCTILIEAWGDVLGGGSTMEIFAKEARQQLEELFVEIIKEEVSHTIEVTKEAEALEALGIGAKVRQKYEGFSMKETPLQLEIEVLVDLEDFGRIR